MNARNQDAKDEPREVRVMVVEDDTSLRETFSAALRDFGHDVRGARDGSAALRILESGWTPGVVFLDLRMPGMDGWEFARRLRLDSRWDGIRLVIVAGHLQVEEEANKLGADAWLKKPFDLVQLDRQARLAR